MLLWIWLAAGPDDKSKTVVVPMHQQSLYNDPAHL